MDNAGPKSLAVLLLLLLFAWLVISLSPKEAVEPVDGNVRVIAHYMPWFQKEVTDSDETIWKHWQWYGKGKKHDPDSVIDGRHDIASVFYPTIGPYHGQDEDVLEYHVLTAKLAGIEAFMCNWYGPGSFTDQTVAKLMPIAGKLKFKVGICMEEKALFPPYSEAKDREDLIEEMARHVRHIIDAYGDSDAFLTHDGLPIIFIFNSHGEGALGSNLLAAEEIEKAKSIVQTEFLLVRNDIDSQQFPSTEGAYLWCAEKDIRDKQYGLVAELKSQGKIQYAAAVVSPGFDDSGVQGWGNIIRQLERRGTDEYLENWQEAIESNFDALQVVTWNDFEEGTTVEPSLEYGFTFVDQTELQIEKLAGRNADCKDNQLGLEVYQLRKSPEAAQLKVELDLVVASVVANENAEATQRLERLKKKLEQDAGQ